MSDTKVQAHQAMAGDVANQAADKAQAAFDVAKGKASDIFDKVKDFTADTLDTAATKAGEMAEKLRK